MSTFEAISESSGGQLRRALRVRHLVMLSVGGTIASGFLLFAGSAINIAGPAVIISYVIAGIITIAVMACLAELCVMPLQRLYAASARFYGEAFAADQPRHGRAIGDVAGDLPAHRARVEGTGEIKPDLVENGAPRVAEVKRAGEHLTAITYGFAVHTCLAAAAAGEQEGISAAVLDLRTLLPLDREAILAAARQSGKIMVVHEDTRTGGLAGEIAATICEAAFEYLDAPILRVTGPDVPAMPFSQVLEAAFIPTAAQVAAAMRELARY